MPIDAMFLSALAGELKTLAVGAVVDKVQQPARDTVILSLRGLPRKLLINIGTGSARVCLTDAPSDNPPQPPMFCMLLRKHLTGARILDIQQLAGDRIIQIRFQCRDALGVLSIKNLTAELMGRNSNLILSGEDGMILDCMRRIAGGEEIRRPVLPGLLYCLPESRSGLPLLTAQTEEIAALIASAPAGAAAAQWMQRAFSGLAPLICRELVYRAFDDIDALMPAETEGRDALVKVAAAYADDARRATGGYLLKDVNSAPKDFALSKITHYGDIYICEEYDDLSRMLDEFYTRRDIQTRMQTAARDLHRTVKTARDRVQRRLAGQRQEYARTEERDTLRENGDIITANIWSMRKGMHMLRAADFYSDEPDAMREIPLDPLKTPQQNAAKYYKDYTRAKTARSVLTEQIRKGENELYYLESVLSELDRADNLKELAAVRQELEAGGWVRSSGGKKRKGQERSGALRFVSPSGFEIFVGRSNLENDRLTLKQARKSDLWLHVKALHGSHVVISAMGQEPDEETVLMAAGLAAWYSQARYSGRTAVDVTYIKNVSKPSGALPGRVNYTDYYTVYALPAVPQDTTE